jgi:cytidyltransferase-like protein
MKHIAVYPGTFDPVTLGHIDLVERSLGIFDELIIAIAANPKKAPLFPLAERIDLFKTVTKKYKHVVIEGFDGLLVDYVKRKNAAAIIRGLRAVSRQQDRDGVPDAERGVFVHHVDDREGGRELRRRCIEPRSEGGRGEVKEEVREVVVQLSDTLIVSR